MSITELAKGRKILIIIASNCDLAGEAEAFTTISAYDGRMQAGVLRRKSRDISPVMTVINLEPFHLCVPVAKNPTLSTERNLDHIAHFLRFSN